MMTSFLKTYLFVAIGIASVFATAPRAKADPLFFSNVVALQNGGNSRVDLFSSPNSTLIGPQVNFLVDITGMLTPEIPINTLLLTYTEAGRAPIEQSFQIPLFGTVHPPFTLLFAITAPGATPQGIAALLTIDLLGSSPDFIVPGGPNSGQRVNSYTYSFNVAQPVPEPATLLLFVTGLIGIGSRCRPRREP